MSVSRRSPMTSGRLAPVRMTDSRCSGGSGLARDDGRRARGVLDDLKQRAVAWRGAERVGDRRVGVGGDEERARVDREAALGEPAVVDAGAEALDDRGRVLSRGRDGDQAALPDGQPQRRRADHQDLRLGRQLVRQEPGRGLGRGDDVGLGDRGAHALEEGGDRGRGAGGVVGHVRDVGARPLGLLERLRRTGNGGAADVDDAVEVEEEDVVGFGERFGHGPSLRCHLAELERGSHLAQCVGVVLAVRVHRRGQGQVLGGGLVVAGAGE